MAKTLIHVQMSGVAEPAHIVADKVEEVGGTGKTILKRNDKIVAEFARNTVNGWWIQEID